MNLSVSKFRLTGTTVAYTARIRAATRVPLGVHLHVKPVHIPTPAAAPVLDFPWIMPITEHSVPRPDLNPVSVDSGIRTVTKTNSSDPPVKPMGICLRQNLPS